MRAPPRSSVVAGVIAAVVFVLQPSVASGDLIRVIRDPDYRPVGYQQLQQLPSTLPPYYGASPTSPYSGWDTRLNISTATTSPTLAGSAVNPNATFSYIVGTSQTSNPAIGLDFHGGGAIAYDYSIPLRIEHQSPGIVEAGETFTIDPFLNLNGTPSLSASQTIDFGTDFFFGLYVNMPWPIPDIDIDVDEAIPNVSFGGVTITAEGSGAISTSGSTATDFSSSNGAGAVTVTTNEASMDAWSVSADLIALAEHLGVPGMSVIDALGFDLDLGLGMPIYREDAVAIRNYTFSDISLTVPNDAEPGDIFSYEVEAQLTYDLLFQSSYDYGGEVFMEFDGPFFDPLEVFEWDLGQFDVETETYLLSGLTQNVLIQGHALVGDCGIGPSGQAMCWVPYVISLADLEGAGNFNPNPYEARDGTSSSPAYMTEASEGFVELYQATVPEPSSLLLMLLGVGALPAFARRRSNG